MKSLVLVTLTALTALAVLPLAAQTQRFRSNVAVVRVDTLVTDGRRPVTGLTTANFDLRDNGVPQTILDVHFETLPLNIICALDVSGSVAGDPLAQLKDAFTAVVGALGGQDRAALITFSNRLALHTRLTRDRDRLRAAAKAVDAGGSTAFFDGVFAALALREADEGRTLLLLFSDGLDTASWLDARATIDTSRRTDVVIYPVTPARALHLPPLSTNRTQGGPTIGVRPPADYVLGELADNTGGRVVHAADDRSLRETFLGTLNEFRQRYVISYEPTGVPSNGWHTIDVKLKGRSGQVKARRGYAGS
jgi:VWFA-related protein